LESFRNAPKLTAPGHNGRTIYYLLISVGIAISLTYLSEIAIPIEISKNNALINQSISINILLAPQTNIK